ncbi:MAG: hypothetical protein OEU93_02220 [Rubrivivax sp.]|nr:hypothetical protein [Rubrivivax sp.]MDH5338615.1 hypothetical protein [Rubrivivax sp.]
MQPPETERGLPAWSEDLIKRKDGGVVRVELVFAAPGRAPEVRVLSQGRFDELVAAVRDHVDKLRVPCLPAGAEPARIVQAYVFRPDDGRPSSRGKRERRGGRASS